MVELDIDPRELIETSYEDIVDVITRDSLKHSKRLDYILCQRIGSETYYNNIYLAILSVDFGKLDTESIGNLKFLQDLNFNENEQVNIPRGVYLHIIDQDSLRPKLRFFTGNIRSSGELYS